MIRTIRLTESELRQMISESVRRVLKEGKYSNNIVPRGGETYIDDDGNFANEPVDPFYDEYNSPEARDKRKKRWNNNNSFNRLWIDCVWENKDKILNWLKNDYESLKEELLYSGCQWNPEPDGNRIAWNKDLELWELSDGGYAILVRRGKEENWLSNT